MIAKSNEVNNNPKRKPRVVLHRSKEMSSMVIHLCYSKRENRVIVPVKSAASH